MVTPISITDHKSKSEAFRILGFNNFNFSCHNSKSLYFVDDFVLILTSLKSLFIKVKI